MHEASLMNGLMRQLEKIGRAEGATRITGIHVWMGALSHMSHEHFCEHFEIAAKDTLAEGARVHTTLSDDIGDKNAQTIILEDVEIETPDP
ncbi:MAG: hydrogenase/urease maturation nickel metallochaperone HypA [Alphaproteobacteria bacterium]